MEQPIEDLYFNWLCAKVMDLNVPLTPSLTHWNLFRQMHSTEYIWVLEGDDNRAADGLDLRLEFVREFVLTSDAFWLNQGCSVLEMLIAFSRRAAFDTDISVFEWFWRFMANLGLDTINDAVDVSQEYIADILNRFIFRTYDYNGVGGICPLISARRDQRKVEVWYQFCDLLIDQGI